MTRILIIRRDNIGDLVCTTPLLSALRSKLPDAYLAAYVNTYNVAVLAGNPDLDAVHAYAKGKHRGTANVVGHYWQRLRQLWALRQARFDDVIIAEPGYSPRLVRLARFLRASRIIGFAAADGGSAGLTHALPRGSRAEVAALHEVEDVFRLLAVYQIAEPPPPVRVIAAQFEPPKSPGTTVGIHISARKPSQRWAPEKFAALALRMHREHHANIRIFWAPGTADDALHPGDDDKAQALLAQLDGIPVVACATHNLAQLIDALAGCDSIVCSDGGAMHLAGGLGKPIVCLFGKSDAVRWRPWGVPYELLQKPSEDVQDISVAEVFLAWQRLPQQSGSG